MKERERQREIVDIKPKKEAEFPEDPEKRFEAVFSALGNSEAKCLTLLLLGQSPSTSYDLHKKFLEECDRAWKTNHQLQATYCLQTLIPIGLVIEADTLYYGASEYVTGFRLTEAGLKYGQPIAAFLLEQSSKLPYSLLEIFGSTKKGGETRGVLNRAKILEFLQQKDSKERTVDIARQPGLGQHVVGAHLRYLSKLGLVEYSSVNIEEKGWAKYTLLEKAERGKVEKVDRHSQRLVSDVADLLFEQKNVDIQFLAEQLKGKYPQTPINSLKMHISAILSSLVKQGICQPELFVGRKIQSQAEITRAGKDLVSEIILPIKQALKDDEDLLSSWRKIPWQNYAKKAILKFKETSGHANLRSPKEQAEEVFTIISQSPGIRAGEIKSLLGREPNEPLRILLDRGRIRKEKKGRASCYFPQVLFPQVQEGKHPRGVNL